MKKVKCLIVFLVSILCLTGCKEESPEKILENALAKMKDVKTYQEKVKMEVGSDLYVQIIELVNEYAENSSHTRSLATLAGKKAEEEIYTIKKDGKLYTYHNVNDKGWTYSTINLEEDSREESFAKLNTNYKSVKKVKSEKEGYTKLEVELDNSKAGEVLGSDNSLEGMDPTKNITLEVYIKDGYIAIMKADFRNTLTEEYAQNITKYSMSIEWSRYNKIKDFSIPSEIEKNAKLEEQEEE